MYRKLKRTWSHNNANYPFTAKFRKAFPELEKMDSEELCNRLSGMEIDFYTEEIVPVHWSIRLTLPLALLVFVLMLFLIPLYYIFKGQWGYTLGKKNLILNWFKALGLQ